MADRIYKAQIENKDLQERLQTVNRQYKIVLQEEDKVLFQKRKIQDEYVSVSDPYISQHAVVMGCFPCYQSGNPPPELILALKPIDT